MQLNNDKNLKNISVIPALLSLVLGVSACCGSEEQRERWRADKILKYNERVIRSNDGTLILGYQGEDFTKSYDPKSNRVLLTRVLSKYFQAVTTLIVQDHSFDPLQFDRQEMYFIAFEQNVGEKKILINSDGKLKSNASGFTINANFNEVHAAAVLVSNERFLSHYLFISLTDSAHPDVAPFIIQIPISTQAEISSLSSLKSCGG